MANFDPDLEQKNLVKRIKSLMIQNDAVMSRNMYAKHKTIIKNVLRIRCNKESMLRRLTKHLQIRTNNFNKKLQFMSALNLKLLKSSTISTENTANIINLNSRLKILASREIENSAQNINLINNEQDLLPENFQKKASDDMYLFEFPRFTTFISQSDLRYSPMPSQSRRVVTKLSDLFKRSRSRSTRSAKESFSPKPITHQCPIVPNYVPIDHKQVIADETIVDGEDDRFILSIIYTNMSIQQSSIARQRTFSGSYYYRYYGRHKTHNMYYGNFGFVDGINAETSKLRSNKGFSAIDKKVVEADGGLSRESFLALSHMFNLRKLIGDKDAPRTRAHHNEKLTMILHNRRCSYSGSTTNSQSGSVASVDFTLMNEFTQRLVDNTNEDAVAADGETDKENENEN